MTESTFELDGRRYTGPIPQGAAALDLYDRAMAALVIIGLPAFTPSDDIAIISAGRQLAVAKFRPLVLKTLEGWTCGGAPVVAENFAELFASKPLEPWVATIRVWVDSGFFHVPVPGSPEDGPATKKG